MKPIRKILSLLLALLCLLPTFETAAEGEARPEIRKLRTEGAIVHFETDVPVAAYCFTTLDILPDPEHPDWRPCSGTAFAVFKMDGTYFLRVRTEGGTVSDSVRVTVSSGFRYTIEAEGLDHLMEPIDTFLADHGDSIDAFNQSLAESAIEAGLYSRAAVGNVCMTFLTRLSDYGMTLSYQPSGNFTAQNDWGISPAWGTKMKKTETDSAGKYTRYSMNCGTIIIWAFKQAGLNLNSTGKRFCIGNTGLVSRMDDNKAKLDQGETGDIIATKTSHTMLILDRIDTDGDGLSDSYLVFEMESPYLKLKIRSLHSVRMCTLYRMGAFFDDSGAYRRFARYWEGSFYIPKSAFPDCYQSASAHLSGRRILSLIEMAAREAAVYGKAVRKTA